MRRFYVVPEKLTDDSEGLHRNSVFLSHYSEEIRNVDLSCMSDSIEERIRQTVMALGESTEEGSRKMMLMSEKLNDIALLYRNTEDRLLGKDKDDRKWDKDERGKDKDDRKWDKDERGKDKSNEYPKKQGSLKPDKDNRNGHQTTGFDWDSIGRMLFPDSPATIFFRDFVPNLGPIGYMGDWLWAMKNVEPKDAVRSWFRLGGEVLKNFFGENVSWKNFLFGEYLGTDPLKEALGGYFEKGKIASSVMGVLGQLAYSVIDNKQEFGDDWYKNPRFYMETYTETGIRIGEDIGMKAIVGLGLVSACSGNVPGVAVAAIAGLGEIGLDMELNAIARLVTGDVTTTWVEEVSDVICDTGEVILDMTGDAIEWGVEHIDEIAYEVQAGVEDLIGDAIDFGEGVSDWISELAF